MFLVVIAGCRCVSCRCRHVEIRVESRTWGQKRGSVPLASQTLSHKRQRTPLATTPDKHKLPSSAGVPHTHSHTSRVEHTLDTITSGLATEPLSRPRRSRSRKSHLTWTWSQAFALQRSLHASALMSPGHAPTHPFHAPHAPRRLPRRCVSFLPMAPVAHSSRRASP